MTEPKELSDVPKDIMDRVYNKWYTALGIITADNWSDCGLWHGCALCYWIKEQNIRVKPWEDCTSVCPLGADWWCRLYGDESRINIAFHNNIDDWRVDVNKFLDVIRPYCSDDIDG